MKKLFSSFAVLLFSVAVIAQIPPKCFEIESILVDACSNPEGENEMVRFKVGPAPLNLNNLNVTWPNATNQWLGNCQNATTANLVTALNATIQGCGRIIAPTGGTLPTGAQVILITSTNLQVLANSFANLNDTIYAIFQCSGNTSGHFANSGTGLRTLIMSFNPPSGCGDTVTYNRAELLNINGTTGGNSSVQEGSSLNFAWNGTPTYFNNGCVAPIVELLISIIGDSCSNSPKIFSLSSNTNVNSINWNFGNPASGMNNTANTLSSPHTFTGPGTYTITATITGACGTYTKDTTVTVISCIPPLVCNPTAQINSIGTCVENTVSFTATADSAIASVSWNFGDSGSTSNTDNGTSTTHLFSGIGTYTVTATVTANCGTVTTATYNINIITCSIPCDPTSAITSVGTCIENVVSFTATADSAIASVSWNFGDPGSPSNSANGTSATHLFSGIGTYTVTATVTTDCGTVTTATYTVNIVTCVNPNNICEATISSSFTCLDFPATFDIAADSSILSVNWNFDDPNSNNNTTSGVTTAHEFSAPGGYNVTAIIELSCGFDTLSKLVQLDACVTPPTDLCPALSIPNAFTPNGDGKNDDFKILNPASYQSLQLNVYNRWGELVFSGNTSSAWDGTFNGQSQSMGVYVYTATGVCLNGKKLGMNGSVTLLR
jgi:gliding motility-associated-like protein